MRILAALLTASSLAGAIPLYVGESWSWLLVDRATNAHSYRSAKVVSSAKNDSGVVWKIAAGDSTTETPMRRDTALLLARPDGSQRWDHPSVYFPWEPVSNSLGASLHSQTCVIATADPVPSYRCQSLWNDTLGLVRGRWITDDWILQTHNNKPTLPVADTIKVPDSGSVMIWREQVDSIPPPSRAQVDTFRRVWERTWEIRSRSSDSMGWIRVGIQEKIRTDSTNQNTRLELRFNPVTGERNPARPNKVWSPDEGWWLEWIDSLPTSGLSRYESSFSSSPSMLPLGGKSGYTQWQKKGPQGQDSLNYHEFGAELMGPYSMTTVEKSWNFSRTLLSYNGQTIRKSTLGMAKPLHTVAPEANLSVLIARFPATLVRWRDAQGRTGEMKADQLRHRTGSRNVLFLDAKFPDGTTWKGAIQ